MNRPADNRFHHDIPLLCVSIKKSVTANLVLLHGVISAECFNLLAISSTPTNRLETKSIRHFGPISNRDRFVDSHSPCVLSHSIRLMRAATQKHLWRVFADCSALVWHLLSDNCPWHTKALADICHLVTSCISCAWIGAFNWTRSTRTRRTVPPRHRPNTKPF